MIEGGEVRIFGAVWGWSGMKLLMKHIYNVYIYIYYIGYPHLWKAPNEDLTRFGAVKWTFTGPNIEI